MSSSISNSFPEDAYEVRVSHLSVDFGENNRILDDLELHIKPSEFVAIVGENGAGKSTLLKAIAGEIGLSSGTIRVGGQLIDRPIANVIDRVSVVHQKPDSDLVLHLSIAQNIAIRQIFSGVHPNRFWGVTDSWSKVTSGRLARASWKATIDLSTLVGSLSGGQMQMLNTVIAIRLENGDLPCRLLLLDEHTSQLDHKKARSIMEYTYRESQISKFTVVMVTHRYEEAFEFADRIIVLKDGKIAYDVAKSKLASAADIIKMVEG